MVPSADEQAFPRRFGLWRRVIALALLVAVVGLPVNHLFGYGMLVVAAVIVFVGEVTARGRPWLLAVLIGLAAVVGQAVLSPPRIDEGHNIFLVDGRDNALVTGLPPDVYRLMAAEFDMVYPPERRCAPERSGCWRSGGVPDRPYAFSADGIFSGTDLSRQVDHIGFSDPVWLRLGVTNELRYNWTPPHSDLLRLKRDGRFWMGWKRWQLTMPFFVMYRFPAAYAGSDVCWQGTVLWEERAEQFTRLTNAVWACRTLEAADIGRRIYGVAIKPDSLAMSLEPTVTIHVRHTMVIALLVFAVVSIVGLLVRWRPRRSALPFALIGLSLVMIAIDDMSFIGGLRPLDGGDDGLFYESHARDIVQAVLAGDYRRALMGGEVVFYYGAPGLRYMRALERVLFGDSNLGYLALVLLLPLIVFALYRRFLPGRWALALGLIFVAVPLGAAFGTTFILYAKWAARGFADAAACIFAFAGTLYLVGRRPQGPGSGFAVALGAGLLMALAVFSRPNIAPFVGVMLGGAGLACLARREWVRLAGLCAGFLPVALMPLHNWYFGNVFVLFSANSTHPLVFVMPPRDYLAALIDLVRFDFGSEELARAARQIVRWLSGPSEQPVFVPLHVLAVAVVVRVLLGRAFDPWLRLIAAATLAQHVVSLFYIATPRYHFLSWFFTGLIGAVWLRQEGIAWLRDRFPQSWERARLNPLSREIERNLRRLEFLIGLAEFPPRARPAA